MKKNHLNKAERQARRKKQKEQGYFDGRFAPKIHKHKKGYDRKKNNMDRTDT